MLLLRQVRQQFVGAFRARSSIEKAARNDVEPATRSQVEAACLPEVFKTPDSLARRLKESVTLHEPGRYVVVQKPYGVHNYSYDAMQYENDSFERPVATCDCIWQLSNLLREPGLRHIIALSSHVSGPLILPCNKQEVSNISQSMKRARMQLKLAGYEHHKFQKYSALTLVVGRPKESNGSVIGYVTKGSDEEEMVFSTKRPIELKDSLHSNLSWRTIASGHGCSLMYVRFGTLTRRLPRIVLSQHLDCPVLGDSIFSTHIPHRLIARLGPDAPPYADLPMYFHVLVKLFPKYEGDSDLAISATLPPHFEAMVDLLGFGEALKKFRNENSPISPSLVLQGLDHESPQEPEDFDVYRY